MVLSRYGATKKGDAMYKKGIVFLALFSLVSAPLFARSSLAIEQRFLVALQKYHLGDRPEILNGILGAVPLLVLFSKAYDVSSSPVGQWVEDVLLPVSVPAKQEESSLAQLEAKIKAKAESFFSSMTSFHVGIASTAIIFAYVLILASLGTDNK